MQSGDFMVIQIDGKWFVVKVMSEHSSEEIAKVAANAVNQAKAKGA
jgi:hypothetical protein